MRDVGKGFRCAWKVRLTTAGLLAVAILWISRFNVTGPGLGQLGTELLAYHAARAVIAFGLAWAIYATGRILSADSDLVETMLMGFSAISLAVFGAGLLGILYPLLAVAVVVGFVILGPIPKQVLPRLRFNPTTITGIMVGGLGLILLVNRGLFIGEGDNDVWEHYLHYYDAVVRTHSLGPNDLWVHFFVSKAAGGFFLAALLGDVFCVQLVSWLAALFIALSMGGLVRSATGSAQPGLVTAALALASWNLVSGEAGSMLKHHTVVAALVSGVLYCAWRAGESSGSHRRASLLIGACAAFYLGIHITVVSAIVVTALACVSILWLMVPSRRERAWVPAVLGVASVLGGVCAMLLNYAWTGLALDAPVGLFWQFADRDRFSEMWSPLVVEYWFLGPASVESGQIGIGRILTVDGAWWSRVTRISFASGMIWATIAMVGITACIRLFGGPLSGYFDKRACVGMLTLVVFMAGAIAVAQLFRNSESVFRLYAFLMPMVLAALAIACHLALRLTRASAVDASSWTLMLAGMIGSAWMLGHVAADRWASVAEYSVGRISTRDSLRLAEAAFPGRVSITDMTEFRSRFPDGRRLLFLTYDPAPAYFVPAPPVVSEPSYAFGRRYADLLLANDAHKTAGLLRQEGIGYVAINLRNRLFLGLPFTELFSPERIGEEFNLVWQKDGIFVLGWRQDGVGEPIPDALRRALQVRRGGPLPDEADQLWGREVANAMRNARVSRDQSSEALGWLYEEIRSKYGLR